MAIIAGTATIIKPKNFSLNKAGSDTKNGACLN
jgi:hypothetical protein